LALSSLAACGGIAIVDGGEHQAASSGGAGNGASGGGAATASSSGSSGGSDGASSGAGPSGCTSLADCCDAFCAALNALDCIDPQPCDCHEASAECSPLLTQVYQCLVATEPSPLTCYQGYSVVACGPCDEQLAAAFGPGTCGGKFVCTEIDF
jgi:hypothetical protein